jgi:hypothetical protein
MPIDVTIDRSNRLVIARARGVMSGEDVVNYQRTVWTRPDVAGYDELVDMSDATDVAAPSPAGANFQALAAESAAVDLPGKPTKFAIVAKGDHAFGLARMYQIYRELETKGTKQVRVFRTLPEALAYLGVERLEENQAER